MHNLPEELIEATQNNNLVIFVGAGLSYNLRNRKGVEAKGWRELVENIINHFSKRTYYTSLLEIALNKGETAIDVLNRLEILSKLSKNEIYGYIKNFIQKNKIHETDLIDNLYEISNPLPKHLVAEFVSEFYSLADSNDWGLHKDISNLTDLIITTNYDNAFEITNTLLDRKIKTILINDGGISEKYNASDLILFKLHGSEIQPDTMVIFPEDYAKLYEHRYQRSLSDLKKIFFTKTILFIGTGMGDWQINNILLKTRDELANTAQSHFIITKGKDFVSNEKNLESFLKPVFITDFTEIPHIIKTLLKIKKEEKPIRIETGYLKQAEELFSLAIISKDESTLKKCCELYSKAAFLLNDRSATLYSNWGKALKYLAKLKKSEELFLESIEKFKVALEIEPQSELIAHNFELVSDDLWRLDVKKTIEENIDDNLEFIPVKVCLGLGKKNCGTINPVQNNTCKRCGKSLGINWNDQGHVSGAICKKCEKYIGPSGKRCFSCGNVVPQFYEDFPQ